MKNTELVQELVKSMDIVLSGEAGMEELKLLLGLYLNQLIQNDFQKLILLLYRIDVDEFKLKQFLQRHPGEDAGNMIADLIIERQLQKIDTRKQFYKKHNRFSEEEPW